MSNEKRITDTLSIMSRTITKEQADAFDARMGKLEEACSGYGVKGTGMMTMGDGARGVAVCHPETFESMLDDFEAIDPNDDKTRKAYCKVFSYLMQVSMALTQQQIGESLMSMLRSGLSRGSKCPDCGEDHGTQKPKKEQWS